MPRFDALTPAHKAVRAVVYHTGGVLQTADFTDEGSTARATAALRAAADLLLHHHALEEQYLFPRLRPCESQLVEEMLGQHDEVARLLEVCAEARERLTAATLESRPEAGADLNRRFNELVAYDLGHLAREEVAVLPATWRHVDDGELMAIQGAIIAEMDRAVLFQWLEWMLKGLNCGELVAMLSDARLAREAIRALGAATMEPAAWQAVREQAGL